MTNDWSHMLQMFVNVWKNIMINAIIKIAKFLAWMWMKLKLKFLNSANPRNNINHTINCCIDC